MPKKTPKVVSAGAKRIPAFLKVNQLWENIDELFDENDKKLVVIQLSGGNDGLNTVVPYRNDLYYKARPTIAVPQNKILDLDGELGFSPYLRGLRALYKGGQLAIVNSVGYPNPIRSHFRSMDVWQSGSDVEQYVNSGWIGRYMDAKCNGKNYHLAVEVDDQLSLALKGELSRGVAVSNPKKLFDIVKKPYLQKIAEQPPLEHLKGNNNATFLYKTLVDTLSSAEYIYEKSKIQETKMEYPADALGRQLKTVAQMMISGVETQIYYVTLSGFDTHFAQENPHKRLLKSYDKAVFAFVKDLKKNNLFDNTLIMTFSEFGRRVAENGSKGTDHGAANNLFLIGKHLKKLGFYNPLSSLANLDESGDLIFSVDFRSVYTDILNNWLNADAEAILGKKFDSVNIV